MGKANGLARLTQMTRGDEPVHQILQPVDEGRIDVPQPPIEVDKLTAVELRSRR